MARSGSDRSGSSPRTAASNVARETPRRCASGHSDCRKAANCGSADCAAGTVTSSKATIAIKRLTIDLMVTNVFLRIDRLAQPLDEGDADRRKNEQAMDDRLPHHALLGVERVVLAELTGIEKGPQQVDRRDADDRH